MTVLQLMNRPVTILRRSADGRTDEYGNPTETFEEIAAVGEVQKQQRADEEPDDAGEVSDTRWLGFFPPETELRTGDAIRVKGIGDLELTGDPWPIYNPRLRTVSHLEVPLRITKGASE